MLNWLFNLIGGLDDRLLIPLLIVFLIVGMLFLIKGADLFVDGASSLAKKMGISSLIIGLTIVSFGTSAPETSVSITASLNNAGDLSISNVVGSNIFNFLIVLGSSLLFTKMIINEKIIKRDLPVMIFSSILLLLFVISYGTGNYDIARIEGVILLLVFVLYLIFLFKTTKKDSVTEEDNKKEVKGIICAIYLIIGLLLIVAGGELVTYGAKTLAIKMGVSELIVGLTIVAAGTSLPELMTSIVAAKKGEKEIAIGNVVGSNIFNILFILGASATISPLGVSKTVIFDIAFLIVVTTIFTIWIAKRKELSKKEGIIFILIYLIYLTYIVLREVV